MTKLHVSASLSLPLDWMTLATVVYGSRGSGKTTFGSVIAEEVTKAKQRFCAVDLKGDWYGLKSTADGKGDGIPVVVFGGDHQDVPLEDGAGAFIGETVAGLGQSCVLDLEYLSKGKQTRFLAAFFEALYDHNREPLLLLLDESQRYAPQNTRGAMGPDAAMCLGAVEDIVKLGRKHGIGPVLFTQRGSGLNKEVSELCDMLVAFRTPGPLDQDRIKDWLDANTTKAQRDEVLGQLSGLPTGTAVFASGHPDLKIFGVYPVRRRETFDSAATPKVGQRKQEPKRLATPDLDELRMKMSAAIERQKADDPKELRRRIAELENQLAAEPASEREITAPVEQIVVEVPVLSDDERNELERLITTFEPQIQDLSKALNRAADELVNVTRRGTEVPTSTRAERRSRAVHEPRAPAPPSDGQVKLKRGERAMLDTLKAFGGRLSRTQLGTMVRIRPTGTTMGVYLSTIRRNGFIVDEGEFVLLTRAGSARAKKIAPLSTGELAQMWSSRLKAGERRLFDAVLRSGARGIDKTSLAKLANIDETGTTLGVYLSTLRRNSLILEVGKRFYPGDAVSLTESSKSSSQAS